jgi:rRNA-processing protein FCF1
MAKKDINRNIVFVLVIAWILISAAGATLILQKQRVISGRATAEVKVDVVAPPPPPAPGPSRRPPTVVLEEKIPEEIIPEEVPEEEIIAEIPEIYKIEIPTIQVPGEMITSISMRITLVAAGSLTILAIIIGTISIFILYEFAVLDADALLFAISNRIPLKAILNKAFGKRVRIAITHSTMKELNVLAKSPNAKIRNTAAKALKMIDELKISVQKKTHIELAKKKRMHLITHKKSLVKSLSKKGLSFHHIKYTKRGIYIK